MSPRRLGLIANSSKPDTAEIVTQLIGALSAEGVAFEIEAQTAALIGKVSTATIADLARTCGLLVVLGGDGTILQVLHELHEELPPILGINAGTLGFLTCVSAAAWEEAVRAIVEGSYQLSKRTLLDVEVRCGTETVHRHLVLNDAVISRGERSHLIRLNVFVDRAMLTEYNADGLIMATPTGSTAYSLSAGGPVLTPDSGAFVITPICPHVLTMRPVLVSDRSLISIVPSPGQPDIFLNLDGKRSLRISSEERIRITRAPQTLALAIWRGPYSLTILSEGAESTPS